MSQQLEKLKTLLAELFQLDQADLDFGIYRIMNAKREEITRFLDRDLLPQVREAFQGYEAENRAAVEAELTEAIEKAKELGVDPEATQKVKEIRAKLAQAVDVTALENEVYSHLYNFFRRYYNEGDFISQRRYKEGVYAIPYEGEEVKLHWANHDQYYIKTSEYLRDYAFKLPSGKRVHFKLAQADTEKDNNRAPNGNERRFILSEEQPLAEEKDELVIRFEYRPHPDKAKQAELNTAAVDRILNKTTGYDDWRRELASPRPTEKNPKRTLLEKHLTDYTARNTFDYFIHKDLGGFLRRELDFYIKNEVIHLDDVESETAPRVEQYLSKIKAIRRIAHKIIDFLAQIENFQKKLWLKKKFVVETQYCITLDRIFAIEGEKTRDWLVDQIIKSDAQREEWVKLLAIDEINGDQTTPGYSKPPTPEFLKAHPTLVVDTRHFDNRFRLRLLGAIPDIEEETDGLLIHSENFQALSLLEARYREQVKCIYIDPPYNTGSDEFVYKDSYQHSSWLSMFESRTLLAHHLLADSGVMFYSIDEIECPRSWLKANDIFGEGNFASEIIWEKKKKPSFLHRNIGKVTDFIIAFTKNSQASPPFSVEKTTEGKLTPLNNAGNPMSVLYFPQGVVEFGCPDGMYYAGDMSEGNIVTRLLDDVEVRNGRNTKPFRLEGEFRYSQKKLDEVIASGEKVYISKAPFRPNHIKHGGDTKKMKNLFSQTYYSMETNEDASQQVIDLFGDELFSNPKPEKLVRYIVLSVTHTESGTILDFFAGSGTTGHAVIKLNQRDAGTRKFILVEMGEYFDTVLVPRLKKVIFTPEWKQGKPKRKPTEEEIERSPRIIKVLRLESYEDTLNNLELKRTEVQQTLLEQHPAFREDYMLHYMLDVESRGSASLLNIDRFEDPFNYKLNIATGTAGETKPTVVDLVETFNFLIGLRVRTIDHIAGVRVVTGTNPQGERVLILWRKTKELDNDALDAWFRKQGYNTKDQEYDVIYVNGDNNLENLRRADQTWKVRLLEEEFGRLMFDVQDV